MQISLEQQQDYSDVMNELRASQQLCAELEARCKQQETQRELTGASMQQNQLAIDVRIAALLFTAVKWLQMQNQ